MENPNNSTGHLPKHSTIAELYSYTITPVPALANAALFLVTPFVSPAIKNPGNPIDSVSGLKKLLVGPQYLGPTKRIALLFGGASALGGWMIHDHDLESGAGFTAAWSTLYLIVGGRGSFKALRYGKVWPLILITASGINTLLYTRRFISGAGALG